MKTTTIGAQGPGLNFQGEWSNAVTYSTDDVVFYRGSSYIAKRANTNVTPTIGDDWGYKDPTDVELGEW